MIRVSMVLTTLAVLSVDATAQDLSIPVTIEVTQDVPVKTSERRADDSYGQERGSLYSTEAFRIGKGQRFQMTEIGQEGGCRIEFQGSEYELSSCPWLPGFRDNQSDIFKVIYVELEAE